MLVPIKLWNTVGFSLFGEFPVILYYSFITKQSIPVMCFAIVLEEIIAKTIPYVHSLNLYDTPDQQISYASFCFTDESSFLLNSVKIHPGIYPLETSSCIASV